MSNNNLNVLASKLEKIHISNQPTIHRVSGVRPLAKKTATRKIRWNNSLRNRKGKSVKASRRSETLRKRRAESAKRLAAMRKEAAKTKTRATTAKRKAEEEEAAARSVIAGKTRSQAKKIKQEEGQIKNE